MIDTIKNILGIGAKVKIEDLIKNGAVILDVRTRNEFSGGHVKGSVNLPLDILGAQCHKIKNKEQVFITCCASGVRSGVAKRMLKSNGFPNVRNGGSWVNLKKYESHVGKHKI